MFDALRLRNAEPVLCLKKLFFPECVFDNAYLVSDILELFSGAIAQLQRIFQLFDDFRGIPENVFAGTLERMGAPVLEKFLRRMCGKDLGYYKERMHDGRYPLDRSVEDLKEELASLRTFVQENAPCGTGFRWAAAVVGRDDLIFPAANQFRAWEGTGVRVVGTDCAHYDRDLFGSLLCCPGHFPVIPGSNSDVIRDSLSEVIPESASEVVQNSLSDVIPSVAEGSESPRP